MLKSFARPCPLRPWIGTILLAVVSCAACGGTSDPGPPELSQREGSRFARVQSLTEELARRIAVHRSFTVSLEEEPIGCSVAATGPASRWEWAMHISVRVTSYDDGLSVVDDSIGHLTRIKGGEPKVLDLPEGGRYVTASAGEEGNFGVSFRSVQGLDDIVLVSGSTGCIDRDESEWNHFVESSEDGSLREVSF